MTNRYPGFTRVASRLPMRPTSSLPYITHLTYRVSNLEPHLLWASLDLLDCEPRLVQ